MAKNSPAVRASQTVPATVARRAQEVSGLLTSPQATAEIRRALGGRDPARFLRCAQSYYLHAPEPEKMAEVEPRSFMAACIDAALAGLMPDGREAYIIPRKNRAVFQASWRGLVKLVRRAADVEEIAAEVVYHGCYWKVCLGTERRLDHTPYYALGIAAEDRGSIVAAYATATIKGGKTVFRVVSRDELDDAAERSGSPFDKEPSSVWRQHPAAMARKTAIRRLCDWLPLPDEIREQLDKEASALDVEERAPLAAVDVTTSAPTGDPAAGWGGGQTSAAAIRSRAPKRTADPAPAPAPVETTAREPGEDDAGALSPDEEEAFALEAQGK